MVFTTEGLLKAAIETKKVVYQAMSSTRTQSQLCTSTPILSFVQYPICLLYIYIYIYIYIVHIYYTYKYIYIYIYITPIYLYTHTHTYIYIIKK